MSKNTFSENFQIGMKAIFLEANLKTHDNMKTLRKVVAQKQGKEYTDEQHEIERRRLVKEINDLKNNPLYRNL